VVPGSGVARVPCAPPTKTAKFEMKNWCKSAEEAKAEHLLFEAAVFSSPKLSR